jgi:hypothetical protein
MTQPKSMIVTEEEARRRVCCQCVCPPLATKDMRCVASDCMAWRWYDTEKKAGYCGMAGKP